MDTVFSYVPGDSPLHKLNPVASFLCALIVCIAVAMSPSILFVTGVIVVLLALSASAGVFRQSARLVLGLGALALIALVLQVIFVQEGTVLVQAGPLALTVGGLQSGVLVVVKIVCMVLPLSLAFMTTPLNALSNELVSSFHLPYKYAFAFTTAVRFIPLFAEEMKSIMEAQKARGVNFDGRGIIKKIPLVISLCVPLLVSSVKKTDAIAIGAELRGFDLRGSHSSYRRYPLRALDPAAVAACVALCALAVVFQPL
ncbi:MAG: energy-coupling factor transporter transmembrane component T family protein [Coriobacteriales bacterium]|jgi:energy-coupling factor transport system permease protein